MVGGPIPARKRVQLQALAQLARLRADQDLLVLAAAKAQATAAEAAIERTEAELIAVAEGAALPWAVTGSGSSGDAPHPTAAAPAPASRPADALVARTQAQAPAGPGTAPFPATCSPAPAPEWRNPRPSAPDPVDRVQARPGLRGGPAEPRAGVDRVGRQGPSAWGLDPAEALVKTRLLHALTRHIALDREAAQARRAALQPQLDAARQRAALSFGKAEVLEKLRRDGSGRAGRSS